MVPQGRGRGEQEEAQEETRGVPDPKTRAFEEVASTASHRCWGSEGLWAPSALAARGGRWGGRGHKQRKLRKWRQRGVEKR